MPCYFMCILLDKGNQQIAGIEIQEQLVDMANRSIALNQLDERITMHHMDLKDAHKVFKPAQYSLLNPYDAW